MASPAELMLPPAGTRVIVTGARGGVGARLCELLHACGARVIGIDVAGDPEDEHLLVADLSDPDQATQAVECATSTLGGLDAVVGAAAVVNTIHPAARFPTERWRRDIDCNLSGQFFLLRAAHEALAAARGRAVLVSSIAGQDGIRGQAAYAASKGGVLGLARALASEWSSDGIMVNAVVPGIISTAKVDAMPESTSNRLRSAIPLGRFGRLDELCGLILFLLSPAGAYCHGGIYRIDGGIGLFTEGFYR